MFDQTSLFEPGWRGRVKKILTFPFHSCWRSWRVRHHFLDLQKRFKSLFRIIYNVQRIFFQIFGENRIRADFWDFSEKRLYEISKLKIWFWLNHHAWITIWKISQLCKKKVIRLYTWIYLYIYWKYNIIYFYFRCRVGFRTRKNDEKSVKRIFLGDT